MPVCLHCGELGPEGALFCPKCGYTLPQVESTPAAPATPPAGSSSSAPHPPPGVIAPSPTVSRSPSVPPPGVPYFYPAGGPPVAYLAPLPAGASGPIPPPPGGKYCTRCRTVISFAAVYCPVCQQPQP